MAQPTSVWSAPGRVNLIGEHTDYNRGLALPFAIELRTTAEVTPRVDGLLRLRSAQQLAADVEIPLDSVQRGRPRGWAAYAAGVLAVLRRHGYDVTGADVLVDGQVPPGAGLSSSAALECAVAAAANDAFELGLSRAAVAAIAQEAENSVVGVPCGPMDQRVAMLARADHALLLDFAADTDQLVPFAAAASGQRLVVADTRARHALADGQYADRRARCERAAQTLGLAHLSVLTEDDLPVALASLAREPDLRDACRHVVTENARVRRTVAALRAEEWAELGAALTESHRSLRDDYVVSCKELDLAVDAFLSSGAHGARMTGAGFGGSVIAVVPDAAADVATATVLRAFADAGLAAPAVRTVTPSEGARRET